MDIKNKIGNSSTLIVVHILLKIHFTALNVLCYLAINFANAATPQDCFDNVRTNPSLAKQNCQKLLDSNDKSIDDKARARAFIELATLHNLGGDLDYAHQLLDKAVEQIPLLSQDNFYRYNFLRIKGGLFFNEERFREALPLMQQGYKLATSFERVNFAGTSANDVASTYMELGEYEDAMHYYEQALDIFTRLDRPYSIGISLAGIGIAHYDLGQYHQAVNFLKRSVISYEKWLDENPDDPFGLHNIHDSQLHLAGAYLKLARLEDAHELLNQIRPYFESSDKSHELVKMYTLYSKIALANSENNDALSSIQKAKKLEEDNTLTTSLDVQQQYTLSLQATQHYKEAETAAKAGLALAHDAKHFASQLFFTKWLADFYAQEQNYKVSQDYLNQYMYLYETFLNSRYNPALADLRSIIEVKQQQKEIALLERDKIISDIKMQQQRWILMSVLAFLTLVTIGFFWVLHLKRRQKASLNREINMHKRELALLNEIDDTDDRLTSYRNQADSVTPLIQTDNTVDGNNNRSHTISDNEDAHKLTELFHQHLVELMCLSCDYWEQSTGQTKIELAEQSKIWLVVIDDGRLRTRTMDKYFSFQKLPKKPRWRQVIRTSRFVLIECKLSSNQRERLNDLLEHTLDLHRKLAALKPED